jgi:anti-sigma factor RsiW
VTCGQAVALETLTAYWLDELPAAEAEAVEEHVFACASCAARLDDLAAVAAGVRAAVRGGAVSLVASGRFAAALAEAGLRVREYRLEPGDTVHCTLRSDENAVVAHVRAPLAGVQRVDALLRVELGAVQYPELRIEDVPFDAAADEVLFMPLAKALRNMPAHRLHVRLLSVAAAGDTTLGDYTFAHSPAND